MIVDTEATATRTARASIPERVRVSKSDLAALARIQRKVELALDSARRAACQAEYIRHDYCEAEAQERASAMLDIARTNLLRTRRMLSGLDIARTL